MSAAGGKPPPDADGGPAKGPRSITRSGHNSNARRQSTCTCWICCSVDIIQPALVRQSSPLAEYVSRRLEVLGGVS